VPASRGAVQLLTRRQLDDLAVALRGLNYRGGLALELNPGNPEPVAALCESKRIAEEIFREERLG